MNFSITKNNNKQNLLLVFGLLLAIVLGSGIVFSLKIMVTLFSIIIGAALVLKCSNNPFFVVICLLIIRPSMGAIGDIRFGGIGLQMLSSIILLAGGGAYLYSHKKISVLFSDIIVNLFLIYLALNFISFFVNDKLNIVSSLSLIFRMTTYLLLYILGRQISYNKSHIPLLFAAVFTSCIIPNIVGSHQLLTGVGLDSRGVIAIYGTFPHPNMYANYLVLVCASNLYFIIENKYTRINFISLLINIFFITNCYARAALLSLLIIFGGVAFVKKRSLIFLGLFLIMLFPIVFSDIYSSLYYRFVIVPLETGDYLSSRLNLWDMIFSLFKDNWVVGVGPSLFLSHYSRWAAHNEILRNLVEIGVFGTVVFMLFWSVIFFRIIRYLKASFSNENIIFSLILVTIFWLSLTSNLIVCAEVLWLFWFLLGLIVSENEQNKDLC